MPRPAYVPEDAEDISKYGINLDHNPNDPDLSRATEVLNALHSAMDAAGPNGSIYVPEGTYYFGSEDVYSLIKMGGSQPRGISIYGAGPTKSTLAVTEHMDPAAISNQTAFIYDRDANHGNVEVRGITLNVNAPNLGDLNQYEGGADGFSLAGDSLAFSLYNVRITDTYTRGVRCREYLSSAKYCTFDRIGIEYHKDSGSNTHPFDSLQTPQGNTTVIENCVIKNCPGSAINIRYGDGTYRIRDVYAAGTGSQFLKLSAGERVELRRINHRANTPELESLLPDEPNDGFIGRHFIQSLGDRGDVGVTLDMEEVSTKDHTSYALQVRESLGGPADITLVGDRIAFAGSNIYSDDEVIRDRQGAKFKNVSIGEMSVSDADAEAFETEDSYGSIDTLSTSNVRGVGSTGNITIGTHNSEGEPLSLDVPTEDEVGIKSQDSTEQVESSSLSDWTARWEGNSSNWSVVPQSSNVGDAYVEFAASSVNQHAMSWDKVGEQTDVEVLGLVRVGSQNDTDDGWCRLVGRGGTDSDGNSVGYSTWFVRSDGRLKLRVEKDFGGSQNTIGEVTANSNPLSEWTYLKLRVNGSSVKAKHWAYGTTEPDPWDIAVTDDDVAGPGWTGIGAWSGDTQLFDFFSARVDGESTDSDNTKPEVAWKQPLADETVDGTVTLKINAVDAEDTTGSLSVAYRVDSGSWTTASYNSETGNYEDSWDTTTLKDGTHTLDAKVVDSAGSSDATGITVVTDNSESLPVVDTLSAAAAETDTTDAAFAINWGVTDPDGDLAAVTVDLYDETENIQEDSKSVSVAGDSATGTTELVASGDGGTGNQYTVELTVTDESGNSTSATTSALASGSSAKPQIEEFNIAEWLDTDDRASLTVVWHVNSSDSDLQSVSIEVTESDKTIESVRWGLSGNRASDVDVFDISQAAGKTYNVSLTVSNDGGESASTSKTVNV